VPRRDKLSPPPAEDAPGYRPVPDRPGLLQHRFLLDGRRRSVYGRSPDDCRAKRAALEDAARQGATEFSPTLTLARWLDHWLAAAVRGKKRPATHRTYRELIIHQLKPFLGHRRLAELRPQHVERWQQALEAAGLAPSTRHAAQTVLRAALDHAVRQRLLPTNVAKLAASVPVPDPDVHPLDPAQVRLLLAAADRTEDAALYHLALAMGLREGELLGLRWADLELDGPRPTLAIRYQAQRGQLVPLKRRRAWSVWPLPPRLAAILRHHHDALPRRAGRAAERWEEHDLVFPGQHGKVRWAANLTRSFKRLLRAAGLPETTRFHDLRHSAASIRLLAGEPLWRVSKLLGHGSITTTSRTYAHFLAAEDEPTDPLEALLARPTEPPNGEARGYGEGYTRAGGPVLNSNWAE
jgi:integrase